MKRELIVQRSPKSPVAEVFRTLRTNIQFMNSQKDLKTLLVTSTMPGEGKSWVSSNLAITFAQAGKRVALIDADMRKGRLHTMFQVENIPGLSNYLSGIDEIGASSKEGIIHYVKPTPVDNLFLITCGNIPPNPSELLASEKTLAMIDKLKEVFDIVVLTLFYRHFVNYADCRKSALASAAIASGSEIDAGVCVCAAGVCKYSRFL